MLQLNMMLVHSSIKKVPHLMARIVRGLKLVMIWTKSTARRFLLDGKMRGRVDE